VPQSTLRLLRAGAPPAIPPRVADEDRDGELLARLARSDIAALDLLLARYWTLVVNYLVRLRSTPDAAEDIAQRTFCQLWDRRAEWRAAGSVRALLCRIARNFAISERRRNGARERSAGIFAAETPLNPTPAEVLDGAQLRLALERAITCLPERRREVFVLRCVHDLSYKEIADVLDIAPQTVANQLSAALATLRVSLGNALA